MSKSYTFEALGLLQETMDESFANIVNLASRIFDAPIAFVSVLDKEKGRQFISAHRGAIFENAGACDMPIEESICRFVQASNATLAIPDVLADPRTCELPIVTAEGLRSYIGSPIHTLSGKVIGAICCMTTTPRDWSDGDKDVLEKLALCIDDIVKARALAKEQQNLSQELQNIVSAREEYIAQVGHEIRTPLTGIVASTKMLHAQKLDGQAGTLASILNRSADRLLHFVNTVLDLSKIDLYETPVVHKVGSIGELAHEVIEDLTALAENKAIKLEIDDGLHARCFEFDWNNCKIIMQNLIGNAIKFTDKGAVTIKLGDDSYGQVVIDVTDTGIGIPAEFQSKVFLEFEQADETVAQNFGGSGLGLTIVKRLVDRMDGRIALVSETGKGTTFSLSLPLQEVKTAAAA
ncbi:GAF domain-containing sensor histidine kinase [Loktanella sp. SALINAS62]|uniref:GAF domain-containing sensor histidine kinase n=1 Tax=Loktanella sp. SALINAS62 TaxID=2706124 RepID=UPI001B8BFC22|nr:GAF domain-containing sensor histidine kinase [Loktanella sp. SALINAS62]MBS1303223.1 GAF domain-containing sensor histidine kinase [Loktanella sp. SALINAS62]